MSQTIYRVAIVGSCDPSRAQELDLTNVAAAKQAGEDIGLALAKKGFHIVVYSSDINQFEVDVVRGYTKAQDVLPDCIEVRFSSGMIQPRFTEQLDDDPRFHFVPDYNNNWEIGFYQSIAQVDGMILLGGGSSTLIAGTVALGHKKAIVVVAGFGGRARKIWQSLASQSDTSSQDDISRMANSTWSANSGEKLVAILDAQFQKQAQQDAIRLKAEQDHIQQLIKAVQSEDRLVNQHVVLALVSLVLGIATFAITVGDPATGSRWWSLLMVVSAVLTGITGATTSVVYDKKIAGKERALYPVIITVLLGAVSGFASAVLFILAQAFANPTGAATSTEDVQYDRLILYTAIVGLVAGLTFENVFSRLRQIDVVQTDSIDVKQS